MSRIYKGQSALRITVKTFTALDDMSGACIKYRKLDGASGAFPAALIDADRGVIFHECLEGEIDQAGWWVFWAFITFADGRSAAGEAAKVFVWGEGK